MAEDTVKETQEKKEESEKLKSDIRKAEKTMKNAGWFLLYLVIFLFVIWLLFFKIIGITHMPSSDMEPRIDAGDLLIFFRMDKKPKFREVILYEMDTEKNGKKTLLVGRVVATPGDTVDINESNLLVVNGNVINESEDYLKITPKRGDKVTYPIKLEEGQYFVLSDDRMNGMDSRYFGPVTKKDILGTIITLFRRNNL